MFTRVHPRGRQDSSSLSDDSIAIEVRHEVLNLVRGTTAFGAREIARDTSDTAAVSVNRLQLCTAVRSKSTKRIT